ncbi:hypothetical protein C453_01425 [Haloferax elongans ATCC BAA-1513]|uniref:Uncharacterized protein n=1 Tax=Haloferax elongans ATCC BAA-1513 TaxID=1230453 RepID=M0HXQ1_HALEO|nr:hypothetical protein [Haloferax elongans]ELZ88483.1 hypothetical protein C453_01425 [Haloferax elongans ATCC BAA-1513]
MTDASVPVTQSAVESFAERYLRSLGCTIEQRGDTWDVSVPEGADTQSLPDEFTVVCGTESDSPEENTELLHPESRLLHELLDEAVRRTPAGRINLTSESTEIELPEWLRGGDVEVRNAEFAPYYDRSALVVLFRVSIETVSEYQREFLRVVALDARSGESLEGLERNFLRITSFTDDSPSGGQPSLGRENVRGLVDEGQRQVVDRVQDLIDEVHEEASRAADAEVEEFRQMQQQRIRELEERHESLSSKLDESRATIDASEQVERVEALKQRKQIKGKLEELTTELSDLRRRRDQGFPERQKEIRQRHALDVKVSPLTATQVEYERGEVEIELAEEGVIQPLTVGYGIGVGVTDTVQCTVCGREITSQNPLVSIIGEVNCDECH